MKGKITMDSKLLVLKIAPCEWINASRDKRELSVYQELGADVLVMAKGDAKEGYKNISIDGFKVIVCSTRPMPGNVPKSINRVISIFTWANHARKLNADVISGHDLFGLLIGYISNFCKLKRNRSQLIYDSHEFELGRAVDRTKICLWFIKHLERFLIKKCAFSMIGCDSAADDVQKLHKLEKRPIVIRNTPYFWNLDMAKIAQKRIEICSTLGIPKDTFLIMYHGEVTPKRNVESLIDAVSRNSNIAGIILGNVCPAEYLDELKEKVKELNISNRIYFKSAVPIEELYKYVGAADIGTIFLLAQYRNEYISLPNKFFENIQSMTPIITFEFPEMSKIIKHYGIGLTVGIDNEDEIDSGIEKMRTDKMFYSNCRKNLEAAKRELCWENEKKVLIDAFLSIIRK